VGELELTPDSLKSRRTSSISEKMELLSKPMVVIIAGVGGVSIKLEGGGECRKCGRKISKILKNAIFSLKVKE